MSNRYWRKRIVEEMEQAQKRDMNRQREMQRLYDEALEELQLTIDGLFQRYANKEGLNLAQAKKRASAMDLNIFNRRVKRWVEERDFSPEANKHLRLYNLKGKVSRLELMKQHMKLATAQLAGREEAYVRESLHDEAVRQREIQSGIFGLYAPDSDQFRQQANAIINTPFQGGSWSERIWERQDHLANFLNSAIQRIIMQGKHSTTFQSEVRKKFNSTAYEAKRLLVTETARVQTEVQRQTMEDNGFSQYEYMAEPTACHICKPLDGQIFKVSDMEPGTNAAPMHPNCKCASAPYESREDLEDMFDAIAEGRGDEFFAEHDFMAKSKLFTASNGLRIRGKKQYGTPHDIYLENNTKVSRDTYQMLERALEDRPFDHLPTMVVATAKKLQNGKGLAAYDRATDTLYVSNKLHSPEAVHHELKDGYFAAKNFYDIITHELTHKRHWDAVKRFYNDHQKEYNGLEDAKEALENNLRKYIKGISPYYISKNISENAYTSFRENNINELIADLEVGEKNIFDEELKKKTREVLNYGYDNRSK